jgi:hypothetical protein
MRMLSPRLVITLLALLTFALPAWAAKQTLQVIGWSADEQRFAVRLYTDEISDLELEVQDIPFCPGYVNHEGKKFRGSMREGDFSQRVMGVLRWEGEPLVLR